MIFLRTKLPTKKQKNKKKTEDGWRVLRPKRCDKNNQDKDNAFILLFLLSLRFTYKEYSGRMRDKVNLSVFCAGLNWKLSSSLNDYRTMAYIVLLFTHSWGGGENREFHARIWTQLVVSKDANRCTMCLYDSEYQQVRYHLIFLITLKPDLVSLFNSISAFVSYLMPKLFS